MRISILLAALTVVATAHADGVEVRVGGDAGAKVERATLAHYPRLEG